VVRLWKSKKGHEMENKYSGKKRRFFDLRISSKRRRLGLSNRNYPRRGYTIKWWPIWGMTKRLTERKMYSTIIQTQSKSKIFRNSLHIYAIDVGNSNDLNFDIRALQAPQYNIHRFGIFFADVPRHADVLLILGSPTKKMVPVLNETINQMPEPFYIVVIENVENHMCENNHDAVDIESIGLPNIAARLTRYRGPEELIAVLLKLKGEWS